MVVVAVGAGAVVDGGGGGVDGGGGGAVGVVVVGAGAVGAGAVGSVGVTDGVIVMLIDGVGVLVGVGVMVDTRPDGGAKSSLGLPSIAFCM